MKNFAKMFPESYSTIFIKLNFKVF